MLTSPNEAPKQELLYYSSMTWFIFLFVFFRSHVLSSEFYVIGNEAPFCCQRRFVVIKRLLSEKPFTCCFQVCTNSKGVPMMGLLVCIKYMLSLMCPCIPLLCPFMRPTFSSFQLLRFQRRWGPGPGSAADRDGRHRAAPRRDGAGRHQPARHDR